MTCVVYLRLFLLLAVLLNAATSTLLCYDCDAGLECTDPIQHNSRIVNCNKQYPRAEANGDQLVCLTLAISISGSRGFSMFKSGVYRGCRIIPKGEESGFCDKLKIEHAGRLVIESCNFCNTTRCIP